MKRMLFVACLVVSFPTFADQPALFAGGGYQSMMMIALFLGIFYFMIIRPQQKRAKEHRNLLEGISNGDEIITTGGLLAKVVKVSEQFFTVSIANGVEIVIQKQAIRSVIPKGTIKSLAD